MMMTALERNLPLQTKPVLHLVLEEYQKNALFVNANM
jgi:hypothetical protein